MAIPKITKENVLAAIECIRQEGVPKARESRRYYLEYEGKYFPPKYVVSLAVEDATGKPLKPSDFSGGIETNSVLKKLGFTIVEFPPTSPGTSKDFPGEDTKITKQKKAWPSLSDNRIRGKPRNAPDRQARCEGEAWRCGRCRAHALACFDEMLGRRSAFEVSRYAGWFCGRRFSLRVARRRCLGLAARGFRGPVQVWGAHTPPSSYEAGKKGGPREGGCDNRRY